MIVGVAVVVAVALTVGPAAAIEDGRPWLRPVDGDVVRPFEAPLTRYASGHRGVKFAATPGTPVRAAGGGVVSFAGTVAGALHVVIAHPGGLRTSYSYLGGAAVRTGDVVARGDVVVVTGDGPHEPPQSLHFGLRRGADYLDPMLLFETRDPADLVRLVPVSGEPALGTWDSAADRAFLVREFAGPPGGSGGDGVGGAVSGAAGALAGAAGGLFGAGRDRLADAVGGAVTLVGDTGRAVMDTADAVAVFGAAVARSGWEWASGNIPAFMLMADLAEMTTRFADWLVHREACDDSAPAADGTGGSRHSLVAVAGINSGTGGDGSTFGLDADALGYHPDDIHYYSYAADGGSYEPEDTRGDLYVAAARLDEQIRERQRAAPGREVDLIAHSQGGVVVALFLQEFYDPGDPAYPPLGTVVTLASPHEGAPIAGAGDLLGRTRAGGLLLDGLADADVGVPVGPSMTQLSEHSDLMRDLWARSPYEQLRVTSIGASEDFVVPGNRTDIPGARVTTLAVAGLNDHSNIVQDPGALRAVRAALERRPLPCVGLVDGMRGSVMPVLITRAETEIGEFGAATAWVLGG